MPPVETQVEEPKQIDSAAFIAQRNAEQQAKIEGKPVPVVEKPAEKVAEPAKPAEEAPRLPRSARREINRLRDEAAELRGKLAAYAEMGVKPDVSRGTVAEDDPEPKREDFASDGEYQRAAGKWDGRQEAKKLIEKENDKVKESHNAAEYKAHVQAMQAKAKEDQKNLADYDKVAKDAAEDADAIVVDWAKHDNLLGMIAESDAQAYILYYLAKNQDDLQTLLDLTPNLAKQLRFFARLEERAEKMYSTKSDSTKEAAQASDKPKGEAKDRTHPAEVEKSIGRNTAERDALKPRPSKEVEARGGSAPPESPVPGSAAWMALRNQQTGGR